MKSTIAIERQNSHIGTLKTLMNRDVRWLSRPRGAGRTRTHCLPDHDRPS